MWLQFRGGKGVATFLGGLIAASWPAALVFAVVWLAVAFVTRYSSRGGARRERRRAARRVLRSGRPQVAARLRRARA